MSLNTSEIDKIIDQLKRVQKLQQSQIKQLCIKGKQVLSNQNNVQNVQAPITVCGDIHGQLYDLLELFKIGGDPPFSNYLFLGDFVDRGLHSIQTFLLLLAYKVRYPSRITLIRGNHQSRQITQTYGFYDQCLRKYGSLNVWRYCVQVFDMISLSALIDGSIFCIHGGLSPDIKNIDQIKVLNRKQQPPNQGPICDLMWSDPQDIQGFARSSRGAGYIFGSDTVQQFNRKNNLSLICRAHQLIMQGYKPIFSQRLVTIWSAPNYCYRCGNVAAILQLDQNLQKSYKIFQAAPQNNKGSSIKKAVPDYFM